jgi:hypothetical protein
LGAADEGGSQDLTVRGLPFGTRASAISVPGALFGFPLSSDRSELRDHTLSRLAASGTTPLLTLCR